MTNEFIEKAKGCKSEEELLALAKENGIEMTAEAAAEMLTFLDGKEYSDDELENVAGGVIIQNIKDGYWTVINDKTGEIVGSYSSKKKARKVAEQYGISSEVWKS